MNVYENVIIHINYLVPTWGYYVLKSFCEFLPFRRNQPVDLNAANTRLKCIKLLHVDTLALSSLSKTLHFNFEDAEAAVLFVLQNGWPRELITNNSQKTRRRESCLNKAECFRHATFQTQYSGLGVFLFFLQKFSE